MRSGILHIATVIAAFLLAPAAIAQAPFNVPEHPERPVVVELFSSQSCGNCPEANTNLAEMARRSDVIALTYPVGYWDYLGWDDTFAKPEFTERQKRYNRVLGHRGPYTPQVIYSGFLHGSGGNLELIMERFAERDTTPYNARVAFGDGHVTVSGATDEPAGVVLVRFAPGTKKVTPGKGVNEGKAMTYYNLVTGIEMLGKWSGGDKRFPAPRCASGCVVMVQSGGPEGAVIGVAVRN